MEKATTAIIISILTLVSTFTYVGVLDKDPTHYCGSRELKAYCYDLSSTMKTCYTLPAYTGGKRCTEGWKEIPILPQTINKAEGTKYSCNRYNCTRIE